MSNASNIIAIEKLRGRDNYASWKFAMQAWLQLDDLWEVIIGNQTDASKDRKALSKIILSLENINYCHVQNAKTSKEAWKCLEDAFEDSGLTRRVGLLRKLITTRLDTCKNIEEYIDEITSTAHKLNDIGFNVADDWIGTLLLAGLPEQYRPMIMGLENSGLKITGDSIKVKLLQEIQSYDTAKHIESESAMYSNKNNKTRGPPKCYSCHKIGHFASQCRKNKQNHSNINYNKNKSKKAFMASIHTKKYTNDWYIDSGASAHIVKDESLLRNPTSKTNVSITAANNTNFRSKSVGKAEIDICNGNETSTVEITDALYVPEASVNLLSVSKIVKKGHKILFDFDGGKIYDQEDDIIATASEVNGIYKLDQPSSEKIYFTNEDTTGMLWHRRLGHLNRKGVCRTIPTSLKMFYGHVFCGDCFKTHVLSRFKGEGARAHSNSWWMQWAPGARPHDDGQKGDDTKSAQETAGQPKRTICARCLQAVEEVDKVDIGNQSFHTQCAKCYACHSVPTSNVKIYYGQVFCEECFNRHVLNRNKDNPSEFFKSCFEQWQSSPQFADGMKQLMSGGGGAPPLVLMMQGAQPPFCRCGTGPQDWFQPNETRKCA